MAKDSSSKTSKRFEEKPVIKEEEKPTSKQKKLGKEIDEIFAGKKRKKPVKEKTKKPNGLVDGKPEPKLTDKKKNKKFKREKEGEYAESPARPKRKTKDGLTLYTEEELGINKANAGGTQLCPFDCDCCF